MRYGREEIYRPPFLASLALVPMGARRNGVSHSHTHTQAGSWKLTLRHTTNSRGKFMGNCFRLNPKNAGVMSTENHFDLLSAPLDVTGFSQIQ